MIEALERLSSALSLIAASPLYETEPMYNSRQASFLNAVVKVETNFSAFDLLELIGNIETECGRKREAVPPNSPRTIDIDILLYGRSRIREEKLSIPHPAMKERAFVLRPLTDIDPFLTDPETGELYAERLESLEGQGIYSYSSPSYNEFFINIRRPIFYGTRNAE